MPTVRFDGALRPETQACFPAHGWAESALGPRVVRLPVLRLYQWGGPTFEQFRKHGLDGRWMQLHSPVGTIRNLAVSLRDIHHEARIILQLTAGEWGDKPVSAERDDALTRQREGLERLALLLIAAFTILRRLPDDLIMGGRPFLFESWKSAPLELKTAIRAAEKGTLRELKPLCNLDVLHHVLIDRTAWFERLRNKPGEPGKPGRIGIRDALIHNAHELSVSPGGRSHDQGRTWEYELNAWLTMGNADSNVPSVALFPALLECVQGACWFMQGLVEAINLQSEYERSDWLSLTGSSNDICGCWPPIVPGTAATFPLVD